MRVKGVVPQDLLTNSRLKDGARPLWGTLREKDQREKKEAKVSARKGVFYCYSSYFPLIVLIFNSSIYMTIYRLQVNMT